MRSFRSFLTGILLLVSTGIASGEAAMGVDFSLDIKALSLADEIPEYGVMVVVTGMVTDRRVLLSDGDLYTAEITLTEGEWSGTEEILTYHSIVRITGKEFSDMVPVKPSRTPKPGEIRINSKVLVMGSLMEYRDGVPVIEVEGIRVLPY